MKITAKFQRVRVDMAGYRKALAKELTETISNAAFEWLATVMAAIPSWSGASRATLMPLASKINFTVDIQISNSATDRVSLGLANATGDLLLDQLDDGKVKFCYGTSLPHLIWNEFNNANVTPDITKWRHNHDPSNPPLLNPGPYDFQKKGSGVAERALSQFALPDPRPFIKASKV